MSEYRKYENNNADSVNKVLLNDIVLKLTLKQNFTDQNAFLEYTRTLEFSNIERRG